MSKSTGKDTLGKCKTIAESMSGDSVIRENTIQDQKHKFAKMRDYKMIKGITCGKKIVQ